MLALVRTKLRIHWQRQDFGGNPLADRKTSQRILKMAIGFLEVKWNRIVDASSDSRLGQMLLNSITVMNTNHVQVVDRAHGLRAKGSDDTVQGCKGLVIALRGLLPLAVPIRETPKFGCEKTSLQGIEPPVVTFDLMIILLRLPMVAEHAHGPSRSFVVSGHRAGLSARSQV